MGISIEMHCFVVKITNFGKFVTCAASVTESFDVNASLTCCNYHLQVFLYFSWVSVPFELIDRICYVVKPFCNFKTKMTAAKQPNHIDNKGNATFHTTSIIICCYKLKIVNKINWNWNWMQRNCKNYWNTSFISRNKQPNASNGYTRQAKVTSLCISENLMANLKINWIE